MDKCEELICSAEHLTVWARHRINQYRYNRALYLSTERIEVITRAGYVKQNGETVTKFRSAENIKKNKM
jgi:hypothetical protein